MQGLDLYFMMQRKARLTNFSRVMIKCCTRVRENKSSFVHVHVLQLSAKNIEDSSNCPDFTLKS